MEGDRLRDSTGRRGRLGVRLITHSIPSLSLSLSPTLLLCLHLRLQEKPLEDGESEGRRVQKVCGEEKIETQGALTYNSASSTQHRRVERSNGVKTVRPRGVITRRIYLWNKCICFWERNEHLCAYTQETHQSKCIEQCLWIFSF